MQCFMDLVLTIVPKKLKHKNSIDLLKVIELVVPFTQLVFTESRNLHLSGPDSQTISVTTVLWRCLVSTKFLCIGASYLKK